MEKKTLPSFFAISKIRKYEMNMNEDFEMNLERFNIFKRI
jgi:hypothetical protein